MSMLLRFDPLGEHGALTFTIPVAGRAGPRELPARGLGPGAFDEAPGN